MIILYACMVDLQDFNNSYTNIGINKSRSSFNLFSISFVMNKRVKRNKSNNNNYYTILNVPILVFYFPRIIVLQSSLCLSFTLFFLLCCDASATNNLTDPSFSSNFLAPLFRSSNGSLLDVYSEAIDVATDGVGGWFVAGHIENGESGNEPSFDILTKSNGDDLRYSDIFVAHVRVNGTIEWAVRMGTTNADYAKAIIYSRIYSSSFVYVAVHLYGRLSDGTNGATLMKLHASNGTRVWAKAYGSSVGREQINDMAFLPRSRRNNSNIYNNNYNNEEEENERENENENGIVLVGFASSYSKLVPGSQGILLLLVRASDGKLITTATTSSISGKRGHSANSMSLTRVRPVITKTKRNNKGMSKKKNKGRIIMKLKKRQREKSINQKEMNTIKNEDNQTNNINRSINNDTDNEEEEEEEKFGEEIMMIYICGSVVVNTDGRRNSAIFSFSIEPNSTVTSTISSPSPPSSVQHNNNTPPHLDNLVFVQRAGRFLSSPRVEFFNGAATARNGYSVYCTGTTSVSVYEETDARVMRFNSSEDLTGGWLESIGSIRFRTASEVLSGSSTEFGKSIMVDDWGNIYVLIQSTSRLSMFDQFLSNNNNTNDKEEEEEKDTIIHTRPAIIVLSPNGTVIDAVQARTSRAMSVTAMALNKNNGYVSVVGVDEIGGNQRIQHASIRQIKFQNSTLSQHALEFVPSPSDYNSQHTNDQPQDPNDNNSDQNDIDVGTQDDNEGSDDGSGKIAVWIILTGTIVGVLFAIIVVSVACIIVQSGLRKTGKVPV